MVTKSNGNRKRKTGKEANAGGKMWIPISDRELVREEGLGLQDYWLDCWQTDPFGNRWTLMASGDEAIAELRSTTKAKYRRTLTIFNLFVFKEEKEGKTRSLYVRNLRGSRAITPENLLDGIEQSRDQIEESLDDVEKTLDQIEQKSCETLSFSAFENSSISSQYLFNTFAILDDEKKNDSSTERSGRLELDSFAKATESAPSPDAEITREETWSFAIEEDPWNDPAPLVDHQNSGNCEERLVGVNEEKDIATAPKDDGSVETNITPPISRTFSAAAKNRPEPAPTLPPVESSTEPPEPASTPLVGGAEKELEEVYLEARRKYQERGLRFPYSDQNWAAFERTLRKGMLAKIGEYLDSKGWKAKPNAQSAMMSDYLMYVEGSHPEPYVCIRDNSELKLVPWSHLPAIMSKSVPEVKKVQSR